MEMYQLIMNTAPAIPQMPWVNWNELFARLGDALNVEDLGSLINVDIAAQMSQGPPPEPPKQQSRFQKDVGIAGKARPRTTEASKVAMPPPTQGQGLMAGQEAGIQASNAINFGQ